MSMFGRAVAGAGSGASQIANKYIDEQLAQQRAQVLADIQLQSAKNLDAYTNDPARRAQLRDLAGEDAVSAASYVDRAKLATAQNTDLTDAAAAAQVRTLSATGPELAKQAGLVERARAENQAHDVAPGGEVIIGTGKNNRPTPGELQLAALREGLKGKQGEDRDRAYEAMAKSVGERLKETQTSIDKFLAENPGALTAPKAEEHWYGDSPAKPNPAYDNYQRMLREAANLKKQQADIVQEWRSEHRGGAGAGARNVDPLNLNKGTGPAEPKGSMRAQAGDTDVAAALVQQRTEIQAALDNPNLPADQKAAKQRDLVELDAQIQASGGASLMDRAKSMSVPTAVSASPAVAAPTAAPAAAPKPPAPPAEPSPLDAAGQSVLRFFEHALAEPKATAKVAAAVVPSIDRAEFERDAKTLSREAFLSKYQSRLSDLDAAQLRAMDRVLGTR